MRIFTKTGYGLFLNFYNQQEIKTTDINQEYYLFDGTKFKDANDIEDWVINKAEQIKSERQQIIISKAMEKDCERNKLLKQYK